MTDVVSNTPYDDAYKTMITQCDDLVLPLLNELFEEHYTGSEKIIRGGTEHYNNKESGAQDKTISDSVLEVHGEKVIKYHSECESSKNGDITVRMYRYGSNIAIEDSYYADGELHVKFPKAGVLFLRKRNSTPEIIKIHVEMPTGESVIYPVRTLKVLDYDLDKIFEKKLYFLLPFYIFNYENDLKKYEKNPIKLHNLEKQYVDLLSRLGKITDNCEITATSCKVILELTNKVTQNLTANYTNVRKGMGDIMGGKVLELESLKIHNEGYQQGLKEGLAVKEKELEAANARLKELEAIEARVKELEALLATKEA